ncbi:hypothetical protein cypCar_00007534 [Cyprinus carpio]|nr:hypothetical protein cypCar_00007534 [Cyprinus carpio]
MLLCFAPLHDGHPWSLQACHNHGPPASAKTTDQQPVTDWLFNHIYIHREKTPEVAVGLFGQDPQESFSDDFYRLGFIVVSTCGGFLILLTAYCLLERKVKWAKQ